MTTTHTVFLTQDAVDDLEAIVILSHSDRMDVP